MEALHATLRRALVRAGLAINAWLVALIFIQAAAGFLMLAFFLSFGPAVPNIQAAIATAVGALLLALLSGLIAVIIARRPSKPGTLHPLPAGSDVPQPNDSLAVGASTSETVEQRAETVASDRALIDLALSETARLTRSHPLAALFASGLVGVCLGLDPKLREQLFKLLKLP